MAEAMVLPGPHCGDHCLCGSYIYKGEKESIKVGYSTILERGC